MSKNGLISDDHNGSCAASPYPRIIRIQSPTLVLTVAMTIRMTLARNTNINDILIKI